MNHENESIIKTAVSSTMLLNIMSVNFNFNSNHSNIIDISQYLKFLENKNLNMTNHFPINGSNLYEEVITKNIMIFFKLSFINMIKM